MSIIKEVVNISAAFTNEVNIRQDVKSDINRKKIKGYVPTSQTSLALKTIVRGFMPTSDERVHTITGAYGTGKSHFGLLLANLLAQWDEESLDEFWSKFSNKFPDEAEFVELRLASMSKRFLIVIPDHNTMNDFNQDLLVALSDALQREGIDYQPPSLFQKAINTIDKWMGNDEYKTICIIR